ncbi:MAG: CHASE2 domain-containing protein, partial [Bdellovibrionota bacterium]
MKDRIWLLQLPVVMLFTFGFLVTENGVRGNLENKFLRETVFPRLKTFSTVITDWKFKMRGPRPPHSKVVIVEVDSASLEKVGRWPWHRDATAYLIEKTFAAGAKVVGLDMVFSEPDQRIPPELGEILKTQNLGALVETFETDFALGKVIEKYKDRLVLGYTTETACQPQYDKPEECPVSNPDAIATHPAGFAKFAYSQFETPNGFDPDKTPISSIPTFIANIQLYNEPALHAGYFNAFLDPDGYVRRTSMLMFAAGKPYPSLPLEMARVGLGEDLRLRLDSQQ